MKHQIIFLIQPELPSIENKQITAEKAVTEEGAGATAAGLSVGILGKKSFLSLRGLSASENFVEHRSIIN